MTDELGVTAARRRLRMTLKAIREQKRYPLEQVRSGMEWSISKIIRIESGAVSISVNDLKVLLDFYDVRDSERIHELLELARLSRRRHWASEYREICSHSYMDFLGYEDDAWRISHFHPLFVPGLLQTEEYARAIIRATATRDMTEAEIESRVRLRMARQQRAFAADRDATIRVAIDESALSRPIGGQEILRHQISLIRNRVLDEQVELVIVPGSLGGHLGLGGPFSLLEFNSEPDPDIVFLDNAPADLALVEETQEVVSYKAAFDFLAREGDTQGRVLARLDDLRLP
ncbi:helix-turn-helix transcriptional regulator [Solwaraspora sp. WMMD1047]|uniref:helix-turn-helix domain-containing protein n=1 Tax=Solwaraspora sp. WMMD1047 TaxID=3016102 RepID=UPI002417787C|nr:helix-turn-helix transcriptional regulator [Solwaraspora sp. WMMD1047]MDG4834112.1 helix-turn-helix transcriptional regulator [Solwaraspora sp. WMMD1047]